MPVSCSRAIVLAVLVAELYHVTAQNTTDITKPDAVPENKECPMGASNNMEKDKLLDTLFPGLFINKRNLKPKTMQKVLANIVKSVRRRTLKGVAFNNGQDCCEMVTEVIKPVTVEHEEVTYEVVHLSSEEQLVTMTSCVNAGIACSTSGKCVHRTGYDWVLVWDPTMIYYPPVKFVPMTIYVGCECQ